MGGVRSTYTNNSIVNRMDIGTGDAALLCTTTYSPCCSSTNRDTQWFFPDGSQVQNNGDLPYYRTRNNPDPRGRTGLRSVQLHRNPQGTTTGIFRCAIFDASGVLQSMFVGIYDSGAGECCTLSELVVRDIYAVLQTQYSYISCEINLDLRLHVTSRK